MHLSSLRFFRLAVAFLLAAASSLLAQDTWTFRSPSPTGNRIGSFAYGNGLLVGVGERGEIVTSLDGATWTERESGTTTDYFARVVYGAGRFVAIGSSNIATSADGIAWTIQSAPAPVFDLAFGNGIYVAIASSATDGGNRRFLTSTDGMTWTLRANVLNPYRVLFANGVFVAPDSSGHVLASTDGVNWTAATVLASATTSPFFAAGNNRFLISYGRGAYLSTDGVTWRDVTAEAPGYNAPVPDLGPQSSLGFGGGYFYLQQSRYAQQPYAEYRSADGETWTRLTSLTFRLDFTTLGSGGGVTVASEITSYYGGSTNDNAHVIHSSTDGLAWSTRSTSLTAPSATPRAVYGLGRFFYGGNSSNDGASWAPTGFEPTHAAGDLVFRITSKDNLVTVLVSADGVTSATIDTKIAQPRAVAFGANTYVMIGADGKISSSTDGVTWTARTSTTTNALNDVIFAFNRFIVVGDSSTLLTSPDGLTWTQSDSAPYTNFDLKHLAANADRLLVHASPKTTDATPGTGTLSGGIPVTITAAHAFTSLGFLGDVFLGVAIPPSASSSYVPVETEMWKSTDGSAWTRVPLHLGAVDRTFFSTYGYPVLAFGNGSAQLSARVGLYTISARSYNALLQTTVSSAATAPVITYAPVSSTVHRGETARFAVGATGTGPLSYQWKHDGVAIAGATSPALTLDLVTDAGAGSYTVTITNSAGSATSAAAKLTVLPPVPLVITQQPLPTEAANYEPAILSVAVTGSGPITYQWRRNGQPIFGETSQTLTIFSSSSTYQYRLGDFDVVVAAPYSQVTSQSVQVTWGGLNTSVTPSGQVRIPVGASVSVTASATGVHPPFTYQWAHQSGPDIPGATSPTLTLTNVQGPRTESYAVTITDSAGHHEYASFQLIVVPDGSATMKLETQPVAQAVVPGGDVHLSVTAPAGANYRYQWRRSAQPIPGATGAELTLTNFNASNNGQYDVIVYQNDYSAAIISNPVYVAVGGSRLVNLSALGFAGTGEETFFQGFVLQGSTYDLQTVGPIIRSVGPGLVRLGVQNVLSDPQLSILNASHTVIAANDNWSVAPTVLGLPALPSEMASLGAFALDPGALDSALKLPTPAGGLCLVQASGAGGSTGYVLNEIYAPDYPLIRLVNLSARARVSDTPLIGGFVISGDIPLKVLIRGVGPSLGAQGVAHPLANPKITLYRGSTAIHNNDQWNAAANLSELRAATTATGAFALNENSNDAAMLETLEPGVYSVHVTSVDGTSGIALIEIYEAP